MIFCVPTKTLAQLMPGMQAGTEFEICLSEPLGDLEALELLEWCAYPGTMIRKQRAAPEGNST